MNLQYYEHQWAGEKRNCSVCQQIIGYEKENKNLINRVKKKKRILNALNA